MENKVDLFFTKIDTDIEKRIQKDPLSQQVIWTKYASRLYGKVNSITTEINGYILTALGLEVIEKYREHNNHITRAKRRNLQVIYEMLVIYILVEVITEGKEEFLNDIGFIGKENGKRIYKEKRAQNKEIIINRDGNIDERQILISQEYQGIIARYRTKVKNIGEKKILEVAFKNKKTVEKIEQEFFDIIKKDKPIKYDHCFRNKEEINVKQEIINSIKNIKANKETWLDLLEITDNDKNGKDLMLKIIMENEDMSVKQLVGKFLADENLNKDIKEKLEKIQAVENFLVIVNNIFYEIIKNEKIDLQNKETINELREAHKKVKNEGIYTIISKAIDKSDEEVIKAIIEEHERIQKNLNKKAWIEIKDNELVINHKAEKDINEGWDHNYYIDVVRHIAKSFAKE